MKRNHEPIVLADVRAAHALRKKQIRKRLAEFRKVWREGSDAQLFEELVFCIFTAGASAKMGYRSIEATRSLLLDGKQEDLTLALRTAGAHRFPVERPGYIVVTRAYLHEHCDFALRKKLQSFDDPVERRDWLAQEKRIKGLGYKEASHFLRNVGFKGHAILDKHVMSCLTDLRVVENKKPPATRARYLETELRLKEFATDVGIDFEELDLVLWSMKTGEVLK